MRRSCEAAIASLFYLREREIVHSSDLSLPDRAFWRPAALRAPCEWRGRRDPERACPARVAELRDFPIAPPTSPPRRAVRGERRVAPSANALFHPCPKGFREQFPPS